MGYPHLAVLGLVVANYALGFLFHAPFTFLEPWARGAGLDPATLGAPTASAMAAALLGNAVAFYTLAWLLRRLDVAGSLAGSRLAVGLGVGLLLPFTAAQYGFAGLGTATFLVDAGHELSALALAGAVLGRWAAARERVPAAPWRADAPDLAVP